MKIFTLIVLNILLFSRISFSQWQEIIFPEGFNVKNILSLNGYLFIACSNIDSGVVFRSSDVGVNWISSNNNFTTNYFGKIFRISANGDDYIFINTNDGLFASSDNGDTWIERNSGMGLQIVISLYYKDGIMLAGAFQHNYRSTDFGENWTEISIGSSQQTVGAFIKYNDYFIAGMRDGTSDFLHKSTDDGQSWMSFGNDDYGATNIVLVENSLYAASGTALLKSTDGGENMDFVPGLHSGYYYHRLKSLNSYLLVFHETGIYFKHDDSTYWYSTADALMPTFIVEGESDEEFLYAITLQNKIWKRNLPGFITDVEDLNFTPHSFQLDQNYPNPFNPATSIEYRIGSSEYVTLKVYDILGREVATLVNEEKPAGKYDIEFDGSKLSSGIYFFRLKAGNLIETKKMVLLR